MESSECTSFCKPRQIDTELPQGFLYIFDERF